MKKLTVHHRHHVSKCLSCRKAILMVTGQRLQHFIFILLLRDVDLIYKYLCPVCFLSPHNQEEGTLLSMITYVLYRSCFCKIWALCVSWMYLNLLYHLCNSPRCLISKRRSSIGQTLIKTKYNVKWTIKVLKTKNLPPLSSYMHSFLSTAKLLEKIWLHMVFTFFYIFCLYSKIFLNKPKSKVFKKCPILIYITTSTSIKIHIAIFEPGCSNNDCNLFLLQSLFSSIIVYGIK